MKNSFRYFFCCKKKTSKSNCLKYIFCIKSYIFIKLKQLYIFLSLTKLTINN